MAKLMEINLFLEMCSLKNIAPIIVATTIMAKFATVKTTQLSILGNAKALIKKKIEKKLGIPKPKPPITSFF